MATLPSSQKTIAGKGGERVRQIRHQRHQGGEERGRDDAAEDDHEDVGAAPAGGDQEDDGQCQQPEAERSAHEGDGAQAQQQGQGAAEGGPGGDADDLRADQGIAEHGLQRGAADCEAATDQQGQQDPGQPDQQHHVFLGRGKARAEGNDPGGQDLRDMGEGHVVAAAGECKRRHGGQDGHGEQAWTDDLAQPRSPAAARVSRGQRLGLTKHRTAGSWPRCRWLRSTGSCPAPARMAGGGTGNRSSRLSRPSARTGCRRGN